MKELYQAKEAIVDILEFIATYRLFGILPLDIIAHLVVSITITIIVLRYKKSYTWVFGILIVLGLAKEYYDSFALSANILEHIKDMIINLIYPLVRYGVKKLKEER